MATVTPMEQEPDLMTLEEIAKRMGRSYYTAYELARQDRLPVPVIRIGKRYFFSRRAYERVLEAQHDTEPQTA